MINKDFTMSTALRQDLVLDLAAVSASMLPVVGGKAANLGELIRAELPVPPGVCVTTEAYRQVAASTAIDFHALSAAGPEELKRLSESAKLFAHSHTHFSSEIMSHNVKFILWTHLAGRAREALLAAPIPTAVAEAVADAYAHFGSNVPVAVRSSGAAEDLPYASIAGQQDTCLHIIGPDAVLDAVRRCWASLWTDRAVVYRRTNGIDHRAARFAVI
jgi:rifampicin phosphotransferase